MIFIWQFAVIMRAADGSTATPNLLVIFSIALTPERIEKAGAWRDILEEQVRKAPNQVQRGGRTKI